MVIEQEKNFFEVKDILQLLSFGADRIFCEVFDLPSCVQFSRHGIVEAEDFKSPQSYCFDIQSSIFMPLEYLLESQFSAISSELIEKSTHPKSMLALLYIRNELAIAWLENMEVERFAGKSD
jgi:hypothetical protein